MEALEAMIWGMFRDGMAPSDIDAELHLARGTAHDAVVHHWAVDKASRHHGAITEDADDLVGA